jgi:hypothetical protein
MQQLAAPANGSMSVYFNSYIQPAMPPSGRISFPVNITNVVAQINGTDDPTRVYVVTGITIPEGLISWTIRKMRQEATMTQRV